MPKNTFAAIFREGMTCRQAWENLPSWEGLPAARLQGAGGCDPTLVRALWDDARLFIEFVASARGLQSPGRRDGLDHFKIGDVCELFLAPLAREGYLEVHVTPAGYKTTYFFSGPRELSVPPAGADEVYANAAPVPGGWRAVVGVPWDLAGGRPRDQAWEIFFGRYDYAGRATPDLSSFPPQKGRPDFHRRDRYACLELKT